jgi:hypothetical protein
LVEPVSALTSVMTGETEPPDPAALEALMALPLAAPWRGPEPDLAACPVGAVAFASADAPSPSEPARASARCVADESPPDPPEPDEFPEPDEVPLDPPPEPPVWIVPLGRPPPAVGNTSTYWLTPEFPGGTTGRCRALAAAGNRTMISKPTEMRLTGTHTH